MVRKRIRQKQRMFNCREDVAEKVEAEGLDYFIQYYCSAVDMPDEEMEEAFSRAKEALDRFTSLLPQIDYGREKYEDDLSDYLIDDRDMI